MVKHSYTKYIGNCIFQIMFVLWLYFECFSNVDYFHQFGTEASSQYLPLPDDENNDHHQNNLVVDILTV